MEDEPLFYGFYGHELVARGRLSLVIEALKKRAGRQCEQRLSLYIDETGAPTDVQLEANEEQLTEQLKVLFPKGLGKEPEGASSPPRRGRPRLGVISKEVSLLPRHWQWLSTQRGGASATLRRLVDEERRRTAKSDWVLSRINAAHRFLWDIGGDLPGFEEASRALFAQEFEEFERLILKFPVGIQTVLLRYVTEAKSPPSEE